MKVAIVGFAPASRDLAPYSNPEWEIWGMHELHKFIPRWDRWFELHSPSVFENLPGGAGYTEWLKSQTKPLYMREQFEDIPACQRYPVEEILRAYGRYFTNTVSWMIALALKEMEAKPDEKHTIGLYGVDMAVGSEYGEQRPSCEYFIGLARGKGIEVIVPAECDLLKTAWLYGFEQEPEIFTRMMARQNELVTRQHKAAAARMNAQLEESYLQGATENNLFLIKNWGTR